MQIRGEGGGGGEEKTEKREKENGQRGGEELLKLEPRNINTSRSL